MFTLTWLFRADNVDPETGEQLLDPIDWMKSFGVSSIFDFVVFTPITIFWRIAIVPVIVVWLLEGSISAHFQNSSKSILNFSRENDGEVTDASEATFSVSAFQNTLVRENYTTRLAGLVEHNELVKREMSSSRGGLASPSSSQTSFRGMGMFGRSFFGKSSRNGFLPRGDNDDDLTISL